MFAQESSLFCSLISFKKQELAGANGDLNRKAFHSGDRPFITLQRWTAQRDPVGVMALNAVTTHKRGTLGLVQTTLHRLVSNIMEEVLSSYPGITTTVPSPKLSLKQPMTVIWFCSRTQISYMLPHTEHSLQQSGSTWPHKLQSQVSMMLPLDSLYQLNQILNIILSLVSDFQPISSMVAMSVVKVQRLKKVNRESTRSRSSWITLDYQMKMKRAWDVESSQLVRDCQQETTMVWLLPTLRLTRKLATVFHQSGRVLITLELKMTTEDACADTSQPIQTTLVLTAPKKPSNQTMKKKNSKMTSKKRTTLRKKTLVKTKSLMKKMTLNQSEWLIQQLNSKLSGQNATMMMLNHPKLSIRSIALWISFKKNWYRCTQFYTTTDTLSDIILILNGN